LSSQIPPKAEIAIVGPKPTGRASKSIEYIMRSNTLRSDLTHEEIALLELAREHFRRVEVDESAFTERLIRLVAEKRIDLKRVARVAAHEPRDVRDALRRLPIAFDAAAT